MACGQSKTIPFIQICNLPLFLNIFVIIMNRQLYIQNSKRQKMEVCRGNNQQHFFNQTQHVKNNLQNQQKNSKIIIIIYYAVIYALRITLTIIVWIANESKNTIFSLNDFIQKIKVSVIYQMVFAVVIFLKTFALILILFKNKEKGNQFFQKLLKSKALIETQYKQMDVILTGFLMCIDWRGNIVPFILSIVLQIYDILLCQNYIIRKSLNYVKDSKAFFLYRALVFVGLIINAIALNFQLHQAYRIIFMALSGSLYLWYLTVGRQIFKRQSLNMLINAQVSIFVALAYAMITNITNQTYFQTKLPILEVAMAAFMLIIVSQAHKYFNKYRLFDISSLKHERLKEYDLMITASLERIHQLPEFDALLTGKLAYNRVNNPLLQLKSVGKFYNRSSENLGEENEKNLLKERLAKDHIQQCYEDQLEKNNFDKTLLLQYCQFLYNEHGSIYRLIALLNVLELKKLNPIEKATVFKYRFLVQNTFKKINGCIYEGRLKFELIIQCQQNINGVYDQIVNYLKGYKQIWDNFGSSEVDMKLIQKDFEQNLQLIQQIDEKWSKISQFFSENKYWKRIYYNYLLFIKNERIKQKQLDDSKEYDAGKQSLRIVRPSTTMSAKVETFNSAVLFNKNVAYVKAIYHDKQLLIKNASHNFEYLTNYKQAQLRDCNIEALMPKDLRQKHQTIVRNWMIKGELVNEQTYGMKETQLVVKDGTRQVIKLFKTCFSIQSGLAFVCFLKFEDFSVYTKNSDFVFDFHEHPLKFPSSSDCKGKPYSKNSSSEIRQMQESNIFIKDQAVNCPSQNRQISLIKLTGRLLCAFTILLLVISLAILNSNCNALIDHSDQFVNYMYIYRYPIVLNMNYMRTFLNLGNQAAAKNAILSNTKAMIAAASNQLTLKSLYDQGLNPPNIYYPDSSYPSEFANITYNQIDLFFLIQSSVASLSNPPINRTSKEYKQFAAFLKPSFDTMVNITKNKLHQTLQTLIQTTNYVYVLITIIELTVVFVFTVYMFIKMNKLFGKRKIIVSIIKDFFQDHRKTISSYHLSVENHFYALFNKSFQRELNQSNQVSPKKLQNVLTHNLNKRLKVLSQSSKYNRKYHFLKLFLIINQFLLLFLFISFMIYEMSKISYLQSFQQAGFNFLRYFPTAPIITMGALEKYYSLQYPKQKLFDPKKYDDVISSMYIFGNFAYIGDLEEDSLYFQKQKNYYFGNPCTYNPSILIAAGLNTTVCQSISNGIFSQGLSAYLRYSQKLGSGFIRGEINLTAAQVNEYVLSVNYLTVFVLDSISTWIKQFQNRIKDLNSVSETLGVIIIFVMIVLHVILNQLLLTGILEKQYATIRQIYNFFVPQFILQQDKVVMQKFIMEDFVNRK